MHTPGDMSGSNEASHAESVLSVPQSSWRCVGDSQPSVDSPIDDAIEAIAQPVAGHDEWVARGLSLWKSRNVFLNLIILMCLRIFLLCLSHLHFFSWNRTPPGVVGDARSWQTARLQMALQKLHILQPRDQRRGHHLLCEVSLLLHNPRQLRGKGPVATRDSFPKQFRLAQGSLLRSKRRVFLLQVQLLWRRAGPEEPCSYEMCSNLMS